MDRAISSEFIQKQRSKIGLYAVLAIVVLAAAVWLLRGALSTSVKSADIRTAVVETGDVENTLQASGEVQPELEQVITSPIAAIIQQAYVSAGASVQAGDKILELDKAFTQIEFEKQKDGLALKRNGMTLERDQPRSLVSRFAPRELLVVAGENDALIPERKARDLFLAAQEPKEFYLVPKANHGNYVAADPVEYPAKLTAFFARALSVAAL